MTCTKLEGLALSISCQREGKVLLPNLPKADKAFMSSGDVHKVLVIITELVDFVLSFGERQRILGGTAASCFLLNNRTNAATRDRSKATKYHFSLGALSSTEKFLVRLT